MCTIGFRCIISVIIRLQRSRGGDARRTPLKQARVYNPFCPAIFPGPRYRFRSTVESTFVTGIAPESIAGSHASIYHILCVYLSKRYASYTECHLIRENNAVAATKWRAQNGKHTIRKRFPVAENVSNNGKTSWNQYFHFLPFGITGGVETTLFHPRKSHPRRLEKGKKICVFHSSSACVASLFLQGEPARRASAPEFP